MYKFVLLLLLISHSIFAQMTNEEVPKDVLKLGFGTYKNLTAVHFKNFPGWHTYWINPGDAGLPIKAELIKANSKKVLAPSEWPIPKRFIETGGQIAYGFVDSYSLFYDLSKEKNGLIQLQMSWLICKHICVPGQKIIKGNITKGVFIPETPEELQIGENEVAQRYQSLPTKSTWPSYLEAQLIGDKENEIFWFELKIQNEKYHIPTERNVATLYPTDLLDIEHESIYENKSSLLIQEKIMWDGQYAAVPQKFPPDGDIKKPIKIKFLFHDPVSGKISILEKQFSKYSMPNQTFKSNDFTAIKGLALSSTEETRPEDQKKNSSSSPTFSSFFYYMLMAFIGGFILNFMPCVLPVITFKLYGLIQQRTESRSRIVKHNLAYSSGILFSFLVLALFIITLKNLGTQVGWGFQLQSPIFVFLMIQILFVFSLNLFGLFEFSTPGGRKLGQVQLEDNFSGDFLGGVFATILSTPCSAPFLGTALTFAFTSGVFEIISSFIFIGLGLASPFLVTSIWPNLIYKLPKPGHWMNHLKKVLGVSLLFTIIWLIDVFSTLVNFHPHLNMWLYSSLIMVFAYFQFKKLFKHFHQYKYLISAMALIFVCYTGFQIYTMPDSNPYDIQSGPAHQMEGLKWQSWSLEKMRESKSQNELVFIDFTAKWCFTCKVNERLVLNTDDFKNLTDKYNAKLMVADWTKYDEKIGDFLKSQGKVGVPAYFIQLKNGDLIDLGETISLREIEEAFQKNL